MITDLAKYTQHVEDMTMDDITPAESMRRMVALLESTDALEEIGPFGRAVGAAAMGAMAAMGAGGANAQPVSAPATQQATAQQLRPEMVDELMKALSTWAAGLSGWDANINQGLISRAQGHWDRTIRHAGDREKALKSLNRNAGRITAARQLLDRASKGETLSGREIDQLVSVGTEIGSAAREAVDVLGPMDRIRLR